MAKTQQAPEVKTPQVNNGEQATPQQGVSQEQLDAEAKAKADVEANKEDFKNVVKDAVKEAMEQTTPTVTSFSAKQERNPEMIYAKKGENQKTTFSKQEWALLGNDKAGWVEDVEVPLEVKALEQK